MEQTKGGCGAGKLILLGEHFVVYGTRSLVASIPAGVCATKWSTTQPTTNPSISIYVPDWQLRESSMGTSDVAQALRVLEQMYEPQANVHIELSASIPAGAGLGSSAALAVALIRTMNQIQSIDTTDEETIERANAMEKIFHENPSGVDATAATLATTLSFRRGSLPQKIGKAGMELIVANSGKSRATKEMVAGVRNFKLKNESQFELLAQQVEELIDLGIDAIRTNNPQQLGKAMNQNMQALRTIGVSSEKIEEMIDKALNAGAWGAKLTGAGGGGCIVAIAPSDVMPKVEQALAPISAGVWRFEI